MPSSEPRQLPAHLAEMCCSPTNGCSPVVTAICSIDKFVADEQRACALERAAASASVAVSQYRHGRLPMQREQPHTLARRRGPGSTMQYREACDAGGAAGGPHVMRPVGLRPDQRGDLSVVQRTCCLVQDRQHLALAAPQAQRTGAPGCELQ